MVPLEVWVGEPRRRLPFVTRYMLWQTVYRGPVCYDVGTEEGDVNVLCYSLQAGRCLWSVWFRHEAQPFLFPAGGRDMANKYIAAARAKLKKSVVTTDSLDPYLSKGRPALTAFLCELSDDEGAVRETSILMISSTLDGVRVGLKDEASGGWCFRVGETVADALDAIEKALQGTACAFRGASYKPRKGR